MEHSINQEKDDETAIASHHNEEDDDNFSQIGPPNRTRGKKHFIDDRMLACMDKCKISTRDAMHLISATSIALGHRLEDLVLNRTTVQSMRKEYRRRQAQSILENFNVN